MKIYYKRSVKANITITSKPWLKIKTWAITALPPCTNHLNSCYTKSSDAKTE